MRKALNINTLKNRDKESKPGKLWNKKRERCIIGIAVLCLLLTACGVPSGGADGSKDLSAENSSDMETLSGVILRKISQTLKQRKNSKNGR